MAKNDFGYLFLKLNIWLCFTSLLMVIASALALSIPLSSLGIGFLLPPLLFYFIYVEDRRNISAEDWTNQPDRTRLVQQYRRGLLLTEVVALAGYQILLLFMIHTQTTVGIGYFFLGQLPLVVLSVYGYLKRYPTFDSITVGGTWAFVIVLTVLISSARTFSMDVVTVFAVWFIIVFAGVESRNLQDAEGDTEADKTTLAGHLGAKSTKVMERILKTLGVAIFWFISDVWVATIVVVYLLLLRLFRSATQRADPATPAATAVNFEQEPVKSNH